MSTDKKTTEPTEIARARNVLAAATTAAAILRAELATARAAIEDAKRDALATDTAAAWDDHDAATKRATRLQIKGEAADTEEARAKATLEALERAEMLAAFEAARDASGDRALRAAIEPVAAGLAEINRKRAAIQQAMLAAIVAQHEACDEAHRLGRAAGMSATEITDLLRRDRSPIGYSSSAHDRSEKRPVGAVDAWVQLLAELQGDKPGALDDLQARASRVGATAE